MARCGRWIKTRCCGTVLHVDFNQEPTREELEALARGPCFSCRERQERMGKERAAGLLVACREHGESPDCYILADGSHADTAACPCRFRFHDDCPVPGHLEIAHGRDARWNASRERGGQRELPV